MRTPGYFDKPMCLIKDMDRMFKNISKKELARLRRFAKRIFGRDCDELFRN